MHNNKYISGFLSGLIVLIAIEVIAISTAIGQSSPSIQSCGELLPAGVNFEIKISGNIDTRQQERVFMGEFTVSDDTKQHNPARQKQTEPFVNCVKSLLK